MFAQIHQDVETELKLEIADMNYKWISTAIFLCIPVLMTFPTKQWLPPFNNPERLRSVCTDNNHEEVMRGEDSSLLGALIRHPIMCQRKFEHLLRSRRYEGLIWFMQSLGFCEINRLISQQGVLYHRHFQFEFLRAAFSLVCQRTDNIGRYHLSGYADVFRLIYERENSARFVLCDRVVARYKDLYERCHVDEYPLERSNFSIGHMFLKCTGQLNSLMIRPRTFVTRFARDCDSFAEFFETNSLASSNFGLALANDTVFMNVLSLNLKRAVGSYSQLPHLVLKTRLLLQHFPLAAIKMHTKMDVAARCKLREEFLFEEDAANHGLNTSESATNYTTSVSEEQCSPEDTAFYENLDNTIISEFERLGWNARLGVSVEVCLLLGVVVNSAFLAVLLKETRRHLSTATVLFVFNILFSNALYVASFVCLFSDLFDGSSTYGPSEELQHTPNAPLIIAESLNTHLFAQSEFLKHLAQETLFSLAQNGSLLGLTHLLILVLVVIHRSMAGKAIRLSQRCVICVFALVWFFLIVTHVIFSALQFSAITSLDSLFSKIATGGWQLRCERLPLSDYTEIGERCDRVAVFHTFGVYLLRGHTLFTLVFLCASIVVFVVTLLYHWRIRAQHEFLNAACQEQQSPNNRRETLFNTLLLSLGAFFISVLGQSFVEIAVFWVDDRTGVAELATLYQAMRIASFADPLLNPILVSVRTPAIRRRLRFYLLLVVGMLTAVFCPWKQTVRRKRSRKQSAGRRASSATGTFDSTSGNDSEITLKVLCTKQVFRTSLLRRSRSARSPQSLV